MTYKESYLQFESLNDLKAEIAKDIVIATYINPDRLKMIEEAATEVINEKFGGDING